MPHQIWVFKHDEKHIRTEILGLTLRRKGHDWWSRNSSRGWFKSLAHCHLCFFPVTMPCRFDDLNVTHQSTVCRRAVEPQTCPLSQNGSMDKRYGQYISFIFPLKFCPCLINPNKELFERLFSLSTVTNATLRRTCICSRTPSVEEKVNAKKWPYLIPRWRKSLAWLANWKSWPGRVRRGSSGLVQTSHLSQSSHQPPQSSRKLKRKPGKGEKKYYLISGFIYLWQKIRIRDTFFRKYCWFFEIYIFQNELDDCHLRELTLFSKRTLRFCLLKGSVVATTLNKEDLLVRIQRFFKRVCMWYVSSACYGKAVWGQ